MNPCFGLVARRATELAGFDVLRTLGVRVPKPAGRRILFSGIGAAARAAGVTREHAYRVLSGERQSAKLLRILKQHGLRPSTATAGGAR